MSERDGNRIRFCVLTEDSTAYCWGNFAGPFVVKESEAPDYRGATIGLLVGYAIKAGCHLILLGRSTIR